MFWVLICLLQNQPIISAISLFQTLSESVVKYGALFLCCRLQVSSLGLEQSLCLLFILAYYLCVCEQQRVEEVQQECKELQKALRLLTQERDQLQERQRQQNQVPNTHSHIKVTSQWSSIDGLHTVFEQHITHQRSQVQVICTSKHSPVCVCSHLCFKTFCLQV